MSKRIVLTGVMIMIFCLLAGCSNSERKLIKQGNSNALAYFEGKYGFTPRIIKTESIKESNDLIGPDLNPADSGDVRVFMEYGGRNFEVQITGETVSAEGFDDYQYEEIVQEVKELLSEKLEIVPHGLTVDYGDVYYSDYDSYGREHGKHLINEFYDGTNLKDIFESIPAEGCQTSLGIMTSGADIEDITEADISDSLGNISFALYNFSESFDINSMNEENQESFFSPSKDAIWPYLIYIDDSITYDKKTLTYKTYDKKHCDNLYYMIDNSDGTVEASDSAISIAEAIATAPELNGYKSLGGTYGVQVNTSAVYFWIPVKDCAAEDVINVEYLITYNGPNGREYYHDTAYKTSDNQYWSFAILPMDNINDIKVSLIGK